MSKPEQSRPSRWRICRGVESPAVGAGDNPDEASVC
jgi:hypothetical protein